MPCNSPRMESQTCQSKTQRQRSRWAGPVASRRRCSTLDNTCPSATTIPSCPCDAATNEGCPTGWPGPRFPRCCTCWRRSRPDRASWMSGEGNSRPRRMPSWERIAMMRIEATIGRCESGCWGDPIQPGVWRPVAFLNCYANELVSMMTDRWFPVLVVVVVHLRRHRHGLK